MENYDCIRKIFEVDTKRLICLQQKNNNGKSPFLIAICSGNMDTINSMLDRENSLLNQRIDDQQTPVEIAVKLNFQELFELILGQHNENETQRLLDEIVKFYRSELFSILTSKYKHKLHNINEIIDKSLNKSIKDGS